MVVLMFAHMSHVAQAAHAGARAIPLHPPQKKTPVEKQSRLASSDLYLDDFLAPIFPRID